MVDLYADTCRLPPDAGRERLVVCESAGHWVVALRRELGAAVRIHQTHTIDQCWQVLVDAPASFAVVELTGGNADLLLERMLRLNRELPLCRVGVVADRNLADCQWLIREAGAVHFTCSPRRLKPLAELARRHLDRAPVHKQSPTRRIWANLPWADETFGPT